MAVQQTDAIAAIVHKRRWSKAEAQAVLSIPGEWCAANAWAGCCGTTTATRRALRRRVTASFPERSVIEWAAVRAQRRNQREPLVYGVAVRWKPEFRWVEID